MQINNFTDPERWIITEIFYCNYFSILFIEKSKSIIFNFYEL